MLIAIILFGLLFYRINKLIERPREKRNFIAAVLVLSVILFGSLGILQYELGIAGYKDGEVGSDASFFYASSIKMLNSGDASKNIISGEHAIGYIWWSALIEYFSPFTDVIWIKICNVMVLLHLLLSLYAILRKNGIKEWVALLALCVFALDGIVVWTVIRNLRDIIIVFLLVQTILLFECLKEDKKIGWGRIVSLALIIGAMSVLRFVGVFMIFAVAGYYLLKTINSTKVKISLLFSVVILFVLFYQVYFGQGRFMVLENVLFRFAQSNAARPELANTFSGASVITRFILGSIRYIFLPSPLKYLAVWASPDLAVYSSSDYLGFIGNFWQAQSTFLWWLIMPLSVFALIDKKNRHRSFFFSLGIIVVLYIIMYGYMYGGEADVRHRIILHMLGIVLAVIKLSETRPRAIMHYYPMIALPLFIIAYWWAVSGP